MLRAGLTAAGIDPPEGPAVARGTRGGAPGHAPVKVALRPAAVADPPAVFVPDSLSEDERYELWHERRGRPTPRSSPPLRPRPRRPATSRRSRCSCRCATPSPGCSKRPSSRCWRRPTPTGSCAWPTTPPAGRKPWPRWSRWPGGTSGSTSTRLEPALGHLGRHQRRPQPGYRRLRRLPGPRRRLEAPRPRRRWCGGSTPTPRSTCFTATRTSSTRPGGSPRRVGSPTGRPTCCCARTTSAISLVLRRSLVEKPGRAAHRLRRQPGLRPGAAGGGRDGPHRPHPGLALQLAHAREVGRVGRETTSPGPGWRPSGRWGTGCAGGRTAAARAGGPRRGPGSTSTGSGSGATANPR